MFVWQMFRQNGCKITKYFGTRIHLHLSFLHFSCRSHTGFPKLFVTLHAKQQKTSYFLPKGVLGFAFCGSYRCIETKQTNDELQ